MEDKKKRSGSSASPSKAAAKKSGGSATPAPTSRTRATKPTAAPKATATKSASKKPQAVAPTKSTAGKSVSTRATAKAPAATAQKAKASVSKPAAVASKTPVKKPAVQAPKSVARRTVKRVAPTPIEQPTFVEPIIEEQETLLAPTIEQSAYEIESEPTAIADAEPLQDDLASWDADADEFATPNEYETQDISQAETPTQVLQQIEYPALQTADEIRAEVASASEADLAAQTESEPEKKLSPKEAAAAAKRARKEAKKREKKAKRQLKSAAKARMRAYGEFEHVEADPALGLDEDQVLERIDRGMTNEQPNIVTKSYFQIFRSNVLTLFNLINFFLATLVLVYGEIKNALFIGIATFNMIVGIAQEIRSKRMLEKMSLLSAPVVEVVRSGVVSEISVSEIVMDDVIVLRQGAQIPADSVLVAGECEANESLLTGEQDDVHKGYGDALLSGSFVQAGECRARVTAVGKDNYTSKLLSEAKQFKKSKSELMRSINWIIRIVSIVIFPLGILMFFTNKATASNMSQVITNTVASIVGMIPEGLVVLTSIALAAGILKLARRRTLVQDLYCIETLARVDVLCLDKTGTITEGSMQVEQTHIYSTKYGFIDDIVANMVTALGARGATFEAFAEHFRTGENYKVVKTVPFSSARKWSGVEFEGKGTFLVGAPEFVLRSRFGGIANDVNEFSAQGFRVLVLVQSSQPLSEEMDESLMQPVALIVLSDKIRESAARTFEYFAQQGVTLKVISGDNPLTVSKVAERAGLQGADRFIDASVDLDTPEKIYDACDKYTIFGRVSPKQKKLLVSALKSKGYTVGMTGDGVNDVMALKEADCSIAMASGSEASRNVAQLVLLDSDFASLPSVVAEGRRVINNIERAASLFLVKTTYSVVLTLLLIIFQMSYPFEPIQLTLISGLFVGLPSFFLALEPNDRKVTGNFLGKVFKKALPAGLTAAVMLWYISYSYRDFGVDVTEQISTMSFYVTAVITCIVLLQVCIPYTKERLFLVGMCIIAFLALATSEWARDILSLVPLNTKMLLLLAGVLALTVPVILIMRAQVEAFRALFADIKQFFVKCINAVKKVNRMRKGKKE